MRYHDALRDLLATRPKVAPGGDGYELAPRVLPMSTEAASIWVEFYDAVEGSQRPDGELAAARAFASKAAEHAARIAGIIEIASNSQALSISQGSIEGGARIAEFYLNEHVRLTGASLEAQRVRHLHDLWTWVRSQGSTVTTAALLQRSPYALRKLKAEGLRDLLGELSRRGYVRQIADGWEVRNVRD